MIRKSPVTPEVFYVKPQPSNLMRFCDFPSFCDSVFYVPHQRMRKSASILAPKFRSLIDICSSSE